MTKILPSQVITAARILIDTPFKRKGREIGLGIDCIGVIIISLKKAGLGDYDTLDYSDEPDGTMKTRIEEICKPLDDFKLGSLVVFKIKQEPQHCGIVSDWKGGLGLIHAYQNVGYCREHELIDWWRDRVVGVYALPGVLYDR